MITRRNWLTRGLALGTAALTSRWVEADDTPAAPQTHDHQKPTEQDPARGKNGTYTPVTTPDGSTLPFTMKNGVKEFHLTAEPVQQEFAPGMVVNAWGYNGSTPGPTIEAVEGDRVRLLVTNGLPEHTTIHWHGIFLPNGMDGVGGLNQPHIKPGETFAYEFTLRQHGTFMYHPHADEMVQMAMGMMGFFIIHPRKPQGPKIDRDFAIFPHMWFIAPGTATPNANVMLDFNLFSFNGKVFPGTAPMVVRKDDRVRIRLANISMTSHPLHIHGHRFWVVETDGGQIAEPGRWPETTLNILPGTTRAVDFVADLPGDWAFHCHKNHHAMNAMGHEIPNLLGADQSAVGRKIRDLVPGYMAMGSTGMAEHAKHSGMMPGLPNTLPMMTGEGPFGPIEMGGMFTVFKVRENLTNYDEDPGWYQHPEGTVAWKVDGPPGAASPDGGHEHG